MKLAALAVLAPSLALADDYMAGEEVIHVESQVPVIHSVNTTGYERSYRSLSKEWLIVDRHELTAELRFLTSPNFGGMHLALTDVALLSLRARTQLGSRAEVFGAVDLLPKQPASTDELVWQAATLGASLQPWQRALAFSLRSRGGVLLDRIGYWGQVDLGATTRKKLHRIMMFEANASVIGTGLTPEMGHRGWLVEAGLGGAVVIHDPQGWTGGTLGFRYSVPLAHADMIDPEPRIDLELCGILSFVDNWDVFVKLAIIDRGDASMPGTQLPILDGGFDQRQLVFGVTWHPRSDSEDL